MALELLAKLGLNTSGYEMGIKRAQSLNVEFSKHMRSTFIHVGMGLIGFHGLTRSLIHVINETIRWSKDIESAREEFERLGIAIDEGGLQKIRAMGVELERLKTEVAMGLLPALGTMADLWFKASAGVAKVANFISHPFDPDRNKALDADILRFEEAKLGLHTEAEIQKRKEDQKAILDLRKQIAEVEDRNRTAGLTDEEKLLELTKQRLSVLSLIANGRLSERQTLEATLRSLQLSGEITGLEAKAIKPNSVSLTPLSDSLSSVGGFLPGSRMGNVSHAERIARASEETAKQTKEIAKSTAETAKVIIPSGGGVPMFLPFQLW